jgi:proteic killer suppression protein
MQRNRENLNQRYSKRFPQEIQRIALRKMMMLNRALTIADLRIPPGNHLEKLSGNLQGKYSIRINSQWRICFMWNEGYIEEVEIVDYH